MQADPTTMGEGAFTTAVERHRRELQLHAYRMTGSFEESEDLVQETFLRAWNRRQSYAGKASFRAWLYAIATNACLDALRKRPALAPGDEVLWLQPYPDALLAPAEEEPGALVAARETVELAFLVAMQHLPPVQRAALIVRDVLGWPAADTAALLELSVPAANSALQRARETLRERLPARREEWTAPRLTPEEHAHVARYIEAHERADMDAVAGLLAEDLTFFMPPHPEVYRGRDELLATLWTEGFAMGDWRLVPIEVNLMPATACYLRAPGEEAFRALSIDVLRYQGDLLAEITTFEGRFIERFGLPATL